MPLYLLLLAVVLVSCKKETFDLVTPLAPEEIPVCGLAFGGDQQDNAFDAVVVGNAIYTFGSTSSAGNGKLDYYLIKLNQVVEIEFEKTFGGAKDEEGFGIIQTSDQHLLMVGSSRSNSQGGRDVYIVKSTLEGEIVWETRFRGMADDIGYSIMETSGGEYCLIGTSSSYGTGSRDMLAAWLSSNGEVIKQRVFGAEANDGGADLVEMTNGEIMLYGYTNNNGAVNQDYYLIKLNQKGDSIWSKRYGGDGYQESQAMIKLPSGNMLLCGHTADSDPLHNMWGMEINPKGDVVWEKQYGGSAHDGGQEVLMTKNGNYVFVARSDSYTKGEQDILVVTTDPGGNVIKESVVGCSKNDRADAIVEFMGELWVVGQTNSLVKGETSVFIGKVE